jgi:tRNA pseudouridine55 synthase
MIHGLIAVDKEKGISSHDAVARVRRIFRMKKAGHFGTLDPNATGLLLIAMGQATRFFDFYVKQDKLYSGLIRFGYATRTYDAEGAPLGAKQPVDLGQLDLEALLAGFRGKLLQMPPAFSAKKFKGKPLYT